jgi:sialate O-acetylesterase
VRDQVFVQSPNVPDPVAVRYAWRNAPEANLYNGAGLPAVPFRSDSW